MMIYFATVAGQQATLLLVSGQTEEGGEALAAAEAEEVRPGLGDTFHHLVQLGVVQDLEPPLLLLLRTFLHHPGNVGRVVVTVDEAISVLRRSRGRL